MTPEQFEQMTKWQKETFGESTPLPKLAHLEQGLTELGEAIYYNFSDKRLDFADCFLLLFGAAAADGMTYKDICDAIAEKFEINKKRKWGKPDANGVVNHIKD